MKKVCKSIWKIICSFVIFISLLVTLISIISNKDGIPNVFGYSPFSIQSNSMYPTIKKGDLIITKFDKTISNYDIDDIVSFFAYENGQNIIKTHRISNIIKEENMIMLETKGDNNDIEDIALLTEIDIIGKYQTRIPFIGYLIDFFKNKWVFLFLIIIPLLILFITEFISFIKLYIEYKMVED